MSNERWHLMINGNVQGVSYRAAAQSEAEKLHINGFAKNLSDGRVEVVAEGNPDSLEQFVDWCWEGSPAAEVEDVKIDKNQATGEFAKFSTY
ncbi:acylphosphatase [Marinobacter sp.]|uniref:acylphosphatase n=1 Tax=Marinobacter sp. TaxID=50741 RepID=UPI00384E577D